ncbi:MAG: hypothetical protein INR69_15080 [Mucilaginibacter polytrichastri]|nr:hypothetical protein [Mucilaginibacter polytrichastri]
MKHKSPFQLGSAIVACFLIGTVLAHAFGVGQLAGLFGFGLVAIGMLPRSQSAIFMATPDTSALAAYAGKYEKKLFAVLRNSLDILQDVTTVPGIKNTLKLTKLSVKDGVRAYREQFDAADDDFKYSGRDLSVELLKRDISINPLKYRPTWMSEVMKTGVNPDDIPFAGFVSEQTAIKVAQEVNDNCYLAVKGAGTSVATTFDGLGTLIAAAIAAETAVAGTGIAPVATGAISNTTAVAKFEQMMKAMPVAYRRAGFNIYCSFDTFDKYNEDYREKYKKYLEQNTNGEYYIDNTGRKVRIVPATWMGTSQRLISTPKENLLAGVDGLGDMDKIHTDIELEILRWRMLFALGFQIRDLAAIKVNDQA